MRRTRGRDIVLAFVLLVALALPALVVAFVILCADGRPVLYRQERLGRGGRRFTLHKFRTMRAGMGGAALTVGGDPRVTRIGSWLRRTKIDEWPQLIDVLVGRMTFVGARPEVPAYAALFEHGEARWLLERRPGITDPSSILCRREEALLARQSDPERWYREVLFPAKARLSWRYAERATLWSDVRVLLEPACGRPRFARAFAEWVGLGEEWKRILGEVVPRS